MALQWERAAVSLSVFLDSKSGKTTDLSKEYANTDKALRQVDWVPYGPEKVFQNALRFQIRIDDLRCMLTTLINTYLEIKIFKETVFVDKMVSGTYIVFQK